MTLLTALTLWTGSAKANDNDYDWPHWKTVEIESVPHRCVDLGGYKQLTHIWIEYRRLDDDNRLLGIQLEHQKAINEALGDQIAVADEYIKALELELDTYRLAIDERDTAATIREVALWATVLLEGAVIVLQVVL